ncbi:MAG: dienelactone hydrolase family protein [Armatimonadota bacterium]|jgi:poly(3-hydroxybutyrate) depolymerase
MVEVKGLLKETDLGAEPKELPYPWLLKELSRQTLERRPRYDYRGRSAEEVRTRLQAVRRNLRRFLGLAPRALPVRPTSVVERLAVQFDGFSITPVALERGAGWHITAHLYVPDGLTQPAPAVIHVHGHSYEGKHGAAYARRCRGLARKGFVALFVDFPEAGERKGTGHALWYPVLANMPVQGILVQDNSAALTYLAGLPFVDEKRIGVTGSSGGGNQTVYLCAADDQLAAAAPCNAPAFISEHCNSGSGAYCHCEAVPGITGAGIEYHDLLAAFAPRPLRVFAGIHDPLFPIVGARRAVVEADAAYRGLGARDRCTIEEHYCEHECPDEFRQGVYQFFEHALKRPGDLAAADGEGDDIDMSDARLLALPERPRDFLAISDLYRRRLQAVKPKRVNSVQLNRLLGRAQRSAAVKSIGRFDDRLWARIALLTGDGASLPLVIRKGQGEFVTLAIADAGKAEALKLARGSGSVASFDWRGQGESAPPEGSWWSQRAAHYTSIGGEPLPGGRVTDLLAVTHWLRDDGSRLDKIIAFGGEACLLACLAAVIDPNLSRLELYGMPRTFADAPGLSQHMSFTAWAPGLALITDIPQLLASVGKRAKVKSWLKPGKEVWREGSD